MRQQGDAEATGLIDPDLEADDIEAHGDQDDEAADLPLVLPGSSRALDTVPENESLALPTTPVPPFHFSTIEADDEGRGIVRALPSDGSGSVVPEPLGKRPRDESNRWVLRSTTAEREQPPIEAAHLDRILQNPDFQTEATTCGCPKCDWEVYFANGQYNTSGFQSRADQKALEKEIPWHLIPHEQRDGYNKAYLRECASWEKFGAARGATDAEQAAGEKGDHDLAEMRVRYRNKNAGIKDANVEEKARVVIRGYKCDNIVSADGTAMNRETPTLSHLGVCVVMQIVASFQLDLFAADASSAFLQGFDLLRPAFAKQPSEGWPGLKPGRFVIILKGGFGYLDAPRRWWCYLASILTDLGFVQMSLDVAIFVFYSEGRVNVIIGVHVDDIVGGFTKNNSASDKILADLRNRIDWGKWRLRKTHVCRKGRRATWRPSTSESDRRTTPDL